MSNQFTFIGKIKAIKGNETFTAIDRKTYDSGWTNTTVRFNCVSSTNNVMCVAQGGKWSDDKKNVIKTFSKNVKNEDGSTTKGTKIDIPWAKRFDEKEMSKVAGFKKFYVDTGDYRKRYILKTAVENNNLTDEVIEATGCDTMESAKAELEKQNNKRKSFISEWDFAEYLTKLISSDKYKDSLFKISGYQDVQYNAEKGIFYANYRVNKVALTDDDAETGTHMNVDFYFADDCISENDGVGYIMGWSTYYDSGVKGNGFMPIKIVIRDEKKLASMMRKLNVGDCEIKNIGLVTSVIDGASMEEITMDDLDEETRADIEDGLLDFDDVIKSMGGNKAGERVRELRLVGLDPNKNKAEDTDYTAEDMVRAMPKNAVADDEDI